MRFPVEQRDTEQAVEADFAPYAAGGFADGERFLPVLDIEKLIADGDMSNAAATDADSTEDHNNGTE